MTNQSQTIPRRPELDQTPTFKTAKHKSLQVMRRLQQSSLLVWVLYADDKVGLHKFNANGSHRREL